MTLSDFQKNFLEQTVRRSTVVKRTAERAKIVLSASNGTALKKIAREYNLNILTVRKWVRRWQASIPDLTKIENALPSAENPSKAKKHYENEILSVFDDGLRPGRPPTFSPEQAIQIVALACEVLDDSDEAVSYWTQEQIAAEAQKRGIVTSISQRTVCRFLKSGCD